MRGFSIIALDNPKYGSNVGGALRAAACYGASQVHVSGCRFRKLIKHPTNVNRTDLHIPVIQVDDVLDHVPFNTQVVAVDLIPGAVSLPEFVHPHRAVYVFGAEDATLGHRVTSRAQHVVSIPTAFCMNLASCVNVVLYDRMAKDLVRKAEMEAA